MSLPTDIAVIGAGPYGLSIAAYLRKAGMRFRIFGTPMQSWSERMPKGMMLKSEGFASSLYDPDGAFTIRQYCVEKNIPYEDVGLPVQCSTFVEYGQEFQRRLVPDLEQTDIVSVKQVAAGFELMTARGETVQAKRVVVAAGITHFGYLPPMLAELPHDYVTHSLEHNDLSVFEGKRVAVVGAGASAVDMAALLHEAGAKVELIARRGEIAFHSPTKEPRPLKQRLAMPRSGLGLGWRSKMCTDLPLVFQKMPLKLRMRVVEKHLGPAPGWFVRDKVVGRFPLHLGTRLLGASVNDGKVAIRLLEKDGQEAEVVVDHVIGGTGFRVGHSRLGFLAVDLRKKIDGVDDTPVLSRHFESSIPGLYFVGLASSNTFGPLTRFAYGAKFTAPHLAKHLVAQTKRSPARAGAMERVPELSRERAH